MFPSLGSPSGKKIEKSTSSLSLAERMKIRLQEEEVERKRQEERAAVAAREREEEERRNRTLGVLKGGYVSRSTKRFENMDADVDYAEEETDMGDLECDAYGRAYDSDAPHYDYDYAEQADDTGRYTPEY